MNSINEWKTVFTRANLCSKHACGIFADETGNHITIEGKKNVIEDHCRSVLSTTQMNDNPHRYVNSWYIFQNVIQISVCEFIFSTAYFTPAYIANRLVNLPVCITPAQWEVELEVQLQCSQSHDIFNEPSMISLFSVLFGVWEENWRGFLYKQHCTSFPI